MRFHWGLAVCGVSGGAGAGRTPGSSGVDVASGTGAAGFSVSGPGSEPGAVWFCGAGAGGVAESSGFGVTSGAVGFSGSGVTAGAAGSSAFGAGCGLGLRARLVRAGRSAFAGAAGAGFAAGT